MADDPNDPDHLDLLKGDERIVAEAKARFQRCRDFESTAQARMLDDLKFANADPDNGWQWPNYLWMQRRDDPEGYKPRLTVNKTRIHNLQIINDAKQNKPGIIIKPVGGDATAKAAEIWEGLIRGIERESRAEQAYDTATTFQVEGGIGYIRVITEYVSEDSFEQELRIKRVKNPLNCYMDPDKDEIDGSDATFAFIFEDLARDEFRLQYPNYGNVLSSMPALGDVDFQNIWIDQSHVRVVEYFRLANKKDRLVLMRDPDPQGSGQNIVARWSKIPKAIRDEIDPDTILNEREIIDRTVEWYKIAGSQIIDRGIWPGRYIPLVPVVGEEMVIDGKLDRKGHTRAMKDSQRMYNFWTSAAVEQVALQTKSKWFIPVGGTTNLETYYATLNQQNYPYIPYNALDTEGNVLPPPTPIQPPQMAEAFIKGMQVSQGELMMSSGQYQSQFGQNENATSGKAIAERQRQGDNATYHFIDGLAIGIRQVGVIILDTAPHVYDTRQIKRILAQDGTETVVTVDPMAQLAYEEQKGPEEDQLLAIFNPKVGRYWVASDVGPSYATRRQEAWNAFVQITGANKELVSVIGDLMFRNADFPGALDIAERLKRTIRPDILGEGPEPALVAAQQQNEQLQKLLKEALDLQAEMKLKLDNKERENDARDYENQTRRLKEAGNAESDLPDTDIRAIVVQLLEEMGISPQSVPGRTGKGGPAGSPEGGEAASAAPRAMSAPLVGSEADESTSPAADDTSGEPDGDEQPPVEGARKAPDGQYYVETQPGQFARVEQNAAEPAG